MILKSKINEKVMYANATITDVEVNWSSVDTQVVKAGSPVDGAGRVANNASAIGVLAETIYYGDAVAKVITAGAVDYEAAADMCGFELSAEAKTACAGIEWKSADAVIDNGGGEDDKGVVIVVEENQTVNGYQVPKMTADDVIRAYNAVVAAVPCTLTDAQENQHFAVNQADTVSSDICVNVLYYDKMLLTYVLSGDTVTTEYTEIGGGGINYSTIEQDTGLKWIDGKTIYQKTVMGTVDISTTVAVNKIDDLQNAESIVKIDGTISYTAAGNLVYKLLNAPLDNPNYFFIAKFDSPAANRLNLATRFSDPYTATYVVTVLYTKTT